MMAEPQAGQVDAPQDEQQEQKPEGEVQEQKPPLQERTYTQAEVDRILGKVRKNARYIGRKEAEAELLRQGATQGQAKAAVEQAPADKEPKREDYQDYEAYLDARSDYRGRVAAREENAKEKRAAEEKAAQDREQSSVRDFKKRADDLIKVMPDFAEVIENAEGVMISETMGREIHDSALGPRILYELAKNPQEAERIAGLPKNAQIREIGKMEARLEATATKTKVASKDEGADDDGNDAGDEKEESDEGEEDKAEKGEEAERRADGTFKPKKKPAPEPINPGSGRSANTSSKVPSDKDDVGDWMKKRDAEEARERQARRGG